MAFQAICPLLSRKNRLYGTVVPLNYAFGAFGTQRQCSGFNGGKVKTPLRRQRPAAPALLALSGLGPPSQLAELLLRVL